MRAVALEGVGHRRIEAEHREGERALFLLDDLRYDGAQRRPIDAGSPEDAADARVRVLQVGRGVAVERQHAFPVEDVVAHPIGREIGVFHGTDAEHAGDGSLGVVGEFGILLGHRFTGASDRFLEQLDELRCLAAAALQHLAIGSEHTAERHVNRLGALGQPAGQTRHVEHHREVLGLRCTDDVQDEIGADALDTIDHAREVARGVVETTLALLNDERKRVTVAIGVAGRKYNLGTVALGEHAEGTEPIEDSGESVVVRALTHDVGIGQPDVEQRIDEVEVLGRQLDEQPPQATRLGVAALQRHHSRPSALLEVVGRVELGARFFVEAVEIAE